ncbi:hypothetical protein GFK07_01505 [Salmonella enterica subsp. enterica serovar Enteritidis]|nr:hypothetical protein [Salmonella enterica subsp. enterica serovar Enteritidis]
MAVLTGAPNRLLGLFSPLAAIAFINRKYVINVRNINSLIITSRYKILIAKLINIYVIYVYF